MGAPSFADISFTKRATCTRHLSGPVDPSFRALSGRLNFLYRRHSSKTDSLSSSEICHAGKRWPRRNPEPLRPSRARRRNTFVGISPRHTPPPVGGRRGRGPGFQHSPQASLNPAPYTPRPTPITLHRKHPHFADISVVNRAICRRRGKSGFLSFSSGKSTSTF